MRNLVGGVMTPPYEWCAKQQFLFFYSHMEKNLLYFLISAAFRYPTTGWKGFQPRKTCIFFHFHL